MSDFNVGDKVRISETARGIDSKMRGKVAKVDIVVVGSPSVYVLKVPRHPTEVLCYADELTLVKAVRS